MRKQLILVGALALAISACSKGGSRRSGVSAGGGTSNSPKPQGQADPTKQQFTESYLLELNGCNTGKHDFGSNTSFDDVRTQLCEALQDDKLNSSCAEPLRKEIFEKKCTSLTWNPKYDPAAPRRPDPSIPSDPSDKIDYATRAKVRSALKFLLVDKYEVSSGLTAEEKQATTQFAEDLLSCGLSYLGAKCLDYETVGGELGGTLSQKDGTYKFYFAMKTKGAGPLVVLLFKVDQVEPTVKVDSVDVLQILKARDDRPLDQYLKDPSSISPLAKLSLAPDFQTAATKRLQNPRDVRELFHVSKMLLESNMRGNQFQAARTAVADAIARNKRVIVATQDVQYLEEMFNFITLQIELKKGDLIELAEDLLNSGSENVKQMAATIILDAQPTRLELKPVVLTALKNSSWNTRARAVSALSKVQKSTDDENQLIGMIDDSVNDVGDKAVSVVKSFTVNEKNLPAIKALRSSQSWAVRVEAAKLLSLVNTSESTKDLIDMMDDSVNNVQEEVFKQLTQKTLGDAFIVDLVRQMKSSDWSVRRNTVELLSKIESDLANSTMIGFLDDPVSDVQSLIFAKLQGKTLKDSYLPFLVKNYDSQNWSVRNQTSILIGKVSGVAATNALADHMNDPVRDVQDTIQSHLSVRPLTEESVMPLAANFESQDWQVRMNVAKLLGKINSSSANQALKKQLLKEQVSDVKDQIVAAIKAMKN